MKKLITFLLLSVAAPSFGAVYEWIDDKGVVNFTDSRDNIPARYRGIARERELSEDKNVTVIKDQGGPAAPLEQTPKAQLYGGRDAGWWRSTIGAVRTEMKTIEEGLPAKRQELARVQRRRVLYHKAVDRVAADRMSKEIEADEAKLRELQEKLTLLQRQAGESGVPDDVIYR
jgi:hypothetical protein